MSKQYNQFIQAIMREQQPDKEKLISLASLIRKEFQLIVQREAILTFHRKDGHLVDFSSWLTEEQFKKYIIHVPDLLFFIKGKLWIIELDGYIHYVKDSIVKKDYDRNACYERAKLNTIIIGEWDILIKLKKKADRSATVAEIWPEIKERISKLV